MSSKLVVFEGLDCSGKTSLIKSTIPFYKNSVYSKFMGSKNIFGFIADKTHFTFFYIIEIVYLSLFFIKPNLKRGKIVFQDRYIYSVLTFVNNPNNTYYKILFYFVQFIIVKPDILVIMTVSLEERLKRLNLHKNNYHQFLIENPEVITLRDSLLIELFNLHDGNKIILDTSNMKIENEIEIVMNGINK